MSRKRLIPVLALALSAALMVPSAQAAGTDDSLGVTACVLLPGVAGTAGVNSASQDVLAGGAWDPLQLLDTDPGTFTFAGDAVCAGADLASEAGQAGPTLVAPTTVSITASGTYDNLICGTGTANGTARVQGGAGAGAIDISTQFGVTFVAGQGVLSFTVTGSGNVGPNNVDGGNGAGVISIEPTVGNCVTTPVDQFNVLGAFGGSLSGEGSAVSGTPDSDG